MDDRHFGNWLRRQIDNTGKPYTDFARATGFAPQTLTVWFSTKCPTIRGYNIVRLARGLGVEREVIEERLNEASDTCQMSAA